MAFLYENTEKKEELPKEYADKLATIGISFSNQEDGTRVIVDYSKAVDKFANLLKEVNAILQGIKDAYANDESNRLFVTFADGLQEKVANLREYFEALISFFINPPSKEMLDLTNFSSLMNKTFNDIKSINIQEELDNCIKVIKEKSQELTQHNKEFADSSERLFKENVENRLVSYKKRVENLEFQAMLEDSEKILNDQLKQIDNFSESLRAKLQNLADTYLEFAKDLDTRIKDDNSKFLDAYINSVNSSSKELSSSIESFNATKKEYQVFVKEQNNFLKRSKYVSVFVSSLFGIGIGVSVAFWLYMSQELDNIANYSNQLASIKIIKNDENLVLELPNDADYSNKNGEKRITLKKVKNEL